MPGRTSFGGVVRWAAHGASTPAPSQAWSRLAPDNEKILIPITESASGVSFAVRVHPRAKRDAITGELGSALKLSLTAPPVEGRANQACIEFLAKFLNVPRSSVTIAAGESGRRKVIRISGISAAQLREKLLAVSS